MDSSHGALLAFDRRGGSITRLVAIGLLLGLPATGRAGKVETWRLDSAATLAKGKRERVVVSDLGLIRLGRVLRPTETLDALRVWDLARTPDGATYAATGDSGKVFRREREGPWVEVYDAEDTQALALAVGADGHVFLGTGPSGQVIDLSDPAHPISKPDPKVNYIWALAAADQGDLYAATGAEGQLWKRSARGGDWSLALDTKQPHLLCVVIGPDGAAYAGSDGEGIVYRVGPDGKASVVFDAPQSEVRCLRFGPDGALYAGTATESGTGSGSGPGRSSSSISGGDGGGSSGPDRGPRMSAEVPTQVRPTVPRREDDAKPSSLVGGTASLRTGSPGENAVYRIGPDGAAREVFRAKALIYALAWQGDRLLIGTGPEGQLYEVRGLGRESAPIARLDRGQVLSLLAEPGGDLLIGAGDPGAVVRLGDEYVASGSWTSDVLDAKFPSRFGALAWRAETSKGTSVAFRVRTGNVGEPDATWSEWSTPQSDVETAQANVPGGRFAQVRADLASTDPSASPEVRSMALRYRTLNLPPEIGKLDVPDLAEADGATRQTKLTLKWDVSDPNGDDLRYALQVRKEGWPDWVRLGPDEPLTEKTFAWDTTSVPAGVYRIRVVASDRPSNDPDSALDRERISEPFLVDHQAPLVVLERSEDGVRATLRDDWTRLVRAEFALDGRAWESAFPIDGLFDTRSETLSIPLPGLVAGTHVLTVRATDAAGNLGAGDIVVRIP